MGNIHSFLRKKYPILLNDYFKGTRKEKRGLRHISIVKSYEFTSTIEIGIYTSKFLLSNDRNGDV